MAIENEPKFTIQMPDGEFEATRHNTSMFRHMGELALYDHVFFADEEESKGTYLFSVHPAFEEVTGFMEENGYPAHINLQEVADCDREAFDELIEREASEADDGVPADWV